MQIGGTFDVDMTLFPEIVDELYNLDKWRTISIVPVSKIPRKAKPLYKLKTSGDSATVWVHSETDDKGTILLSRDAYTYVYPVSDKTVGLAIVRDGLCIGAFNVPQGVLDRWWGGDLTVTWQHSGIFTVELPR
jgi:hypothetical protein